MKEFSIYQTEQELVLRKNISGKGRSLLIELVIVFFAFFIVLSFPYDQLVSMNQFLVIIYFLPLLRLPKLYRSIVNLSKDDNWRFDKISDAAYHNDQRQFTLSDINTIYIRGDGDDMPYGLYLIIEKRPMIKLADGGFVSEYKLVGRAIAKIAEVEFWDKRSYHDELLWGKTQSRDSDISALNNHLSKYQ